MREIKFRALCKRSKVNPNFNKWVKETGKRGWQVFEKDTGEKYNLGDIHLMDYDVCVSNKGKMMCLESGWDYQTDDEEAILMQYTGLKDKQGKMIFEGDIIQNKYKEYFVVEFTDSAWMCNKKVGGLLGWSLPTLKRTKECVEVIGNIHENPELLK